MCIMALSGWRPERGALGILGALDEVLERARQEEFGGGKRREKVTASVRGKPLTLPKDKEA
jgi:hypothetical protein